MAFVVDTSEDKKTSKADQMVAMVREFLGDYERYAAKILRVQTVAGKIVPFTLNGPQKILHSIVEDMKGEGRPIRIVALKARRMGFSTYFSGRFYHQTSMTPNQYAVQITHEPEATDTLFKMIKRFYNLSPAKLRPETQYNNTKLLEFNNKDGKGLNSGFRVATAGKEDFGSGQLIHRCHFSEVSKWPVSNISDLLTSVLQCVPDTPDSEVIFESTAKGVGGAFYDRFWSARFRVWIRKLDKHGNPVIETFINPDAKLENVYTSIFLPWFVFEDYQMDVPDDFKIIENKEDRDQCEVTLKELYGLSDRQIVWRRYILANKCNGDINMFRQEYPSTPEEAFIGTGRPVFDTVKLMKMRDTLPEPIARYDALTALSQWITSPEGKLRVWQEPRRGEHYIIGADVAEGLAKGDYSSADVINHRTGEQVAQWHGHIDPDQFGLVLSMLGKRYNTAMLAPERNNHGLTTVTVLHNTDYPNIYSEMVPDPPGKPRRRYGWLTSRQTRPLIIDQLVKEVREDTHGIKSKESVDEMMRFKRDDNGRMEAEEGSFDDRVISLCIAKHVRETTELPLPTTPAHYKKGRVGYSRKISPAAWT